jgi:hypothetical protein
MTSNEIERATPIATNLPDMVRYAEHLANAQLLPGQYRKQPANVLYAMEYGRTLGITPIAAITGIHVIEGKPSASAALISGLVRQAGHKLRVTGNSQKATAQIIRSDDPTFTYEVTWELHANPNGNPNAEDAGLLKKDIWKKYPASMLKSRAISQVARDACEEVLFGLHYTPEELDVYVDQDGNPVDAPVQQLRPVEDERQDYMVRVGNVVVRRDAFKEHPEGQKFVQRAAGCKDRQAVHALVAEAKEAELIHSGILAPDTDEPDMLRDYLARLWKSLPEATAASPTEPEIPDAELVPDEPADPHGDAVKALRNAASNAGLTDRDLDEGFEAAYGTPVNEGTIEHLRAMTATLRGAA